MILRQKAAMMLLMKIKMLYFDVAEPTHEVERTWWKKNKIMAKKIMINSVKDHLILVISKLEPNKEIFKTFKDLQEFSNTSGVLACKNGKG